MAQVTLNRLTKKYDDTLVVKEISLKVMDGEFFSLLGPSGCGKTTILRMIAGFIFPTSGSIFIDDKDLSQVPANRRNTGMVFQNYALFPHMTVFENVAFGLQTRKVAKTEIRDRVRRAIELVGLSGLEHRPAPQLSGGQQQRVALARAVVIEPGILLLDEPLSNLDAKLREETRDQIRDLQKRLGITAIYVTHDQEEALAMSDRIAVMESGKCLQIGPPEVIYRQPANRFVASFIGNMNIWEGRIDLVSDQPVFQNDKGLVVELLRTTDELSKITDVPGPVHMAMHPQDIELRVPDDASAIGFTPNSREAPAIRGRSGSRGAPAIRGTVASRRYKGATIEYSVNVGGLPIQVIHNADGPIADTRPGDEVTVHLPGDQAIILEN